METIKVLLFAANPLGTAPLDLPREFREIDEEVRMSPHRAAVELILVPGARPVDLLRKLNEYRPQVVHLSGHGEPDEIILESGDDEADHPGYARAPMRSTDERDMKSPRPGPVASGPTGDGQPLGVRKSALVDILRSGDEGSLRLVVLNACHTRSQAEALTGVVDCVVGMNRVIGDRAAIKFAASFYGALAFGKSVQKAFEQGIARLSAEGITEADTPELLVRAGVDASQVVLVGPAPPPVARPAAEAPFLVPFPRNADFVGRDDDLARLHATLSGDRLVGLRPAGLTGMGGIGKTQLAVEYVYRYRESYPDGIFWVNAADPLAQGLAYIGRRLRPEIRSEPNDSQLQFAFEELNRRRNALLVFDNVEDPALLARPVDSEATPLTLACRILFTTRRRELGRFRSVEVTILPEGPALQLLLRDASRGAVRDNPQDPERREALAVCRLLGWLPLALELAGALLGEWPDISLADYRKRIQDEGCLPTLAEAEGLSAVNFQPIHAAAVTATLNNQWGALRQGREPARLLFRVAGQFPEATAIPIAALGLFAGVSGMGGPGHPSPLKQSLKHLHDIRLVEELQEDHIRLHPLVREFAAALTPATERPGFRHHCALRVARAFEDFTVVEDYFRSEGVEGLEQCLMAALGFASKTEDGVQEGLSTWLRLFQREAHQLPEWAAQRQPHAFAQQVLFRAMSLGETAVAERAERQLVELARPCLILRWRTHWESPALERILAGHQGLVTSAAVSPDGRRIVSGSDDRAVTVWDLRSGARLHRLFGHQDLLASVAVSPDGRRIVSGSLDATSVVWDLESGAQLHRLVGHQGWVRSVAVSPDGRRIISGSNDQTVAVWDLESGTQLLRLTGHGGPVTSVAVSPDGRHIVSRSLDGTVAVWDLESGARLRRLTGHRGWCPFVAVSPNGRRIVTAWCDRTLAVWDLWSGERLHHLDGHMGLVTSVAISPDGRRLVSGSGDATVAVWDLESGRRLHQLTGHQGWVVSVAVSPDGQRVVSGSRDRTVAVWDLWSGERLHHLIGHQGFVTSVAVSPDGRRIVSGSVDQTVAVWNLESGTRRLQLDGHRGNVNSVAVSPDGRRVVSGSEDRNVAVWDLGSGQRLHRLTGHEGPVYSVAVSPDGRRIASGSGDQTLAVWDLGSGEQLHRLTGHEGPVYSVAVSPDGRRIVSGSSDRIVVVWDLESGVQLRRLVGHQGWVTSVAVSPDGRRIISGSNDQTVAVWDFESGTQLRQFAGHQDSVTSVAVSPDGRRIASGACDQTVAVWDLESGTQFLRLTGHGGPVTSVAVSPDGRRIASGSRDRAITVWDLVAGTHLATCMFDSPIRSVEWHRDARGLIVGDIVGSIYRFEYRQP
jgi:WD40 repeat protein